MAANDSELGPSLLSVGQLQHISNSKLLDPALRVIFTLVAFFANLVISIFWLAVGLSQLVLKMILSPSGVGNDLHLDHDRQALPKHSPLVQNRSFVRGKAAR